jgi:hypothetical protein
LLRYSRLKQGRTDEALPVSIKHFKPIGAGLALTKQVYQDFPLTKQAYQRILKLWVSY